MICKIKFLVWEGKDYDDSYLDHKFEFRKLYDKLTLHSNLPPSIIGT